MSKYTSIFLILAGMILSSCSNTVPSPPEVEITNDGENLLKNGGLETWNAEQNVPQEWGVKWGKLFQKETAKTSEGSTAAALSATPNSYNCMNQYLSLPSSAAGQTLTLTARVNTDIPEGAIIKLFYEINNVWEEKISKPHRGDGKWHTLAVTFKLPGNYPGGKIKVEGDLVAGKEKLEALFDDFRLTVH